jgi:hypothetical protein
MLFIEWIIIFLGTAYLIAIFVHDIIDDVDAGQLSSRAKQKLKMDSNVTNIQDGKRRKL